MSSDLLLSALLLLPPSPLPEAAIGWNVAMMVYVVLTINRHFEIFPSIVGGGKLRVNVLYLSGISQSIKKSIQAKVKDLVL